jgi:hypothetical protein
VRSSSEFQSFLIHPPELSNSNQQTHLVAKQEKNVEKIAVIFSGEVFLSYSAGIFIMP